MAESSASPDNSDMPPPIIEDVLPWQDIALSKLEFLCMNWAQSRISGYDLLKVIDMLRCETEPRGPKQCDLTDLLLRVSQIKGVTLHDTNL